MPVASLGIVRLDNGFETRSWDQLVHSAQKFFLAGLAALVAGLAVRECKLLIHPMRLRSCAVSIISCGGFDYAFLGIPAARLRKVAIGFYSWIFSNAG